MPYPGMEHSAACLSAGRHLNPPTPPAISHPHTPPPPAPELLGKEGRALSEACKHPTGFGRTTPSRAG